ncbi:unnamed protein product [Somion occarium]|uniref:DUF862-domain-containing protein n=1 Tax=Somion occarium TaxID=3059160 RepID=A0ABP1E1F2_9APHY
MLKLVQLYVYDLNRRNLNRHTSVVVFGREIFYGQGISITHPGQSHHGNPLRMVDVGQTDIDEETFEEYLTEMRQHYTADKYHLLDFNCNSFTNDVVGFLTGGSIPDWIKDLPSDFLSTPFGAALRPTIDNMFRRPIPGAVSTPATIQPTPQSARAAINASPDPALASTLLQSVASQATLGPSSMAPPSQSTSTVAAPVHICTNPTSFHNTLKTHRAVVAFFTSATCGPCRMIEPLFDQLAHEKTEAAKLAGGIAFAKIDMGVGMGGMVGSEYGVRVTPTFIFFLDGIKKHEMKGANRAELTSQVNMLLFEAYPPHPHSKVTIPALEKVSTNPILFTQVPKLDIVTTKLCSFVDSASRPIPNSQTIKHTLSSEFAGYLRGQFSSNGKAVRSSATPQMLTKWTETTKTLVGHLPPSQLFPLVDMWRLAILDNVVSSWCATAAGNMTDPIQILIVKALSTLRSSEAPSTMRNYILTTLRLLSNTFSDLTLAHHVLSPSGKRSSVTSLVITTLLHEDASVRTAASSLAFNMAAAIQKVRIEQMRAMNGSVSGLDEDGEWEIELVSAVLEAIRNEVQNEDIVHRLTASLAFLLRLSPVYESQLAPLLEVLQAKETLQSKLEKGGCGEQGVQNNDIRSLIAQVAESLLHMAWDNTRGGGIQHKTYRDCEQCTL